MAVRGPFKRWRLPEPILTVEKVVEVLRELERVYEDMTRVLERGSDVIPRYIEATLSANQTSNLAVGNHVEFDAVGDDSGHITLSTGSGQANGIFTVPQGVWVITVGVVALFSSGGGLLVARIETDTGTPVAAGPNVFIVTRPPSSTANAGNLPYTQAIFEVPSGSADIQLEITSSTAVTSITGNSSISIHSIGA